MIVVLCCGESENVKVLLEGLARVLQVIMTQTEAVGAIAEEIH